MCWSTATTPADWARALGDLLDRPEWLAELGRQAVRQAASFGWERTAEQTRALYAEARAGGPGREAGKRLVTRT